MRYLEKDEWNAEPDVSALDHAATLDFSAAVDAYVRLIDKGSVLSMTNLGRRYEYRPDGYGGPDFELAEYWYRRAIDSGSAISTLPVGYFYIRRSDYHKAFDVFSIGCKRGYAPSIVRLADFYIKGRVVNKDYGKARLLLERATSLGSLWAKRSLARMYFNIGENPLVRVKGLFLWGISDLEFWFEKRRSPGSERLKK